jgi:hypothetical protein
MLINFDRQNNAEKNGIYYTKKVNGVYEGKIST